MSRRPTKLVEPADRAKLYSELDRACSVGRVHTRLLRLRAIIAIAHGAALELDEVLALTVGDVAELAADASYLQLRIKHTSRRRKSGYAVVPEQALPPLRAWLSAHSAPRRPGSPLFGVSGRMVQYDFRELQRAAGTATVYTFNDLRFDALSRFAQRQPDVRVVAIYGRLRPEAALRFLPTVDRVSIAELARYAARSA